MKKRLSVLYLLVISCNNPFRDEPSMEMALEAAKDNEYNNRTEEFIELVDFRKIDGVKRKVFGQELYEFDYQMTAVVKKDCFSPKPISGSNYSFHFMDKAALGEFLRKSIHPKYFTHKKGDTLLVTGDANFEKTENGWKEQWK